MKYTKRMLVSALVLCTITQLSGCKEQNKSNTKPSTEKTSVQTDITETCTTNAIDLPTHTSSDYLSFFIIRIKHCLDLLPDLWYNRQCEV